MQNHNIKILEEYLDKQDRKFISPKKLSFLRAIENIIEDNNDLRKLYRRTADKLNEKGHVELADYFLAQIDEVPTFTVEDMDYYEAYRALIQKIKSKIAQLDENLEGRALWEDGIRDDFTYQLADKREVLLEMLDGIL